MYLATPLRRETEHSPVTDFDPDHTFDETTIDCEAKHILYSA